jgi:regulator of cell morphogenesis and NO signaling
MNAIRTTDTLGDLVRLHPELARELERRGLDYCCGGGESLADACDRAGLEAEQVAGVLSLALSPAPLPEWSTMGTVALVDHLVATHHAYLWDELPRLSALVEKVKTVHGKRHPELAQIGAGYEAIRADLEPHLMKEERVLFPMVRELAAADGAVELHCGSIRNPISVMLREHDAVGQLLRDLRRLTDDYRVPGDGCASYAALFAAFEALEADTHQHIHKENNVLFPMVVRAEAELAAR